MSADDGLLAAASALLAVIEAENAALEAMDFGRAAALLERKQTLSEAFAAAARTATPSPPARRCCDRLRNEAARNRALLLRATGVQQQVVAIVASAGRDAVRQASGYAPDGRTASAGRTSAAAISLRA